MVRSAVGAPSARGSPSTTRRTGCATPSRPANVAGPQSPSASGPPGCSQSTRGPSTARRTRAVTSASTRRAASSQATRPMVARVRRVLDPAGGDLEGGARDGARGAPAAAQVGRLLRLGPRPGDEGHVGLTVVGVGRARRCRPGRRCRRGRRQRCRRTPRRPRRPRAARSSASSPKTAASSSSRRPGGRRGRSSRKPGRCCRSDHIGLGRRCRPGAQPDSSSPRSASRSAPPTIGVERGGQRRSRQHADGGHGRCGSGARPNASRSSADRPWRPARGRVHGGSAAAARARQASAERSAASDRVECAAALRPAAARRVSSAVTPGELDPSFGSFSVSGGFGARSAG